MNVLCEKCEFIFDRARNILTGDETADKPEPSFWSIKEWKNLALSSSCHLCTILYHAVRDDKDAKVILEDPCVDTKLHWTFDQVGTILCFQMKSSSLRDYVRIPLRVVNPSALHFKEGHVCSTVRSASTGSSETVGLVKTWISDCLKRHRICHEQSDAADLPLRLLDLYPKDLIRVPSELIQDPNLISLETANDIMIHLTESLPRDTQYLTLSHRWSGSLLEQLDQYEMIGHHPSTVPMKLLNSPAGKILRHAIQITRILGYRYLWIDALCINQKDELEKAKEIGSMAQIYARAIVNISATGAAQAEDGLFFERDLMPSTPCRRMIEHPSGSNKRAMTIVAYKSDWHEQVDNGPLNQRAWVFQERMLAPRIIHFARRQVFWECFADRASEAFPNGYPDKLWQQQTKSTILYIKRDISRPEHPQVAEADLWSEMVRVYSSQSLTFSKDRLPAISALAKKICRLRCLSPLNYVAGHWDFDLPMSLLWNSPRSSMQRDKQEYLAPSWSWASKNTGAYPWGISARLIADLIDVATCPKHEDPFGEISSGHLILCCSLSRMLWHPDSKSIDISLKEEKVWKQSISPVCDVIMSWDTCHLGAGQSENIFWIPQPDAQIYIRDNVFHLAPICDMPSSRGDIYGLILHRTGRPGQYVRVGTFSAFGKRLDAGTYSLHDTRGDKRVPYDVESESRLSLDRDNPRTTLSQVLLSSERKLDYDDYLEVKKGGGCVIEIV